MSDAEKFVPDGVTAHVTEVCDIPSFYGTPMAATVRTGTWGARIAVECAFSGGNVMTVESAMMLRAALDVAIQHFGGR